MALIYCINCGSQVSDSAPKCPKCGFEFSAAGASPANETAPKTDTGANVYRPQAQKSVKKSSSKLGIIALAVVAVAAAAIFYFSPATYNNLNMENSFIRLKRSGSTYEQQIQWSEDNIEVTPGTYTTSGDIITLSPADGASSDTYVKSGNYLLSGKYDVYEGTLSRDGYFDATVTNDYNYGTNSSVIFMYIFKSDGSFSYGIGMYTGNVRNSASLSYGNYTIKDGHIQATFTSGDFSGETDHLVIIDSGIYTSVYQK